MGLRIATNVQSLSAQRYLNNNLSEKGTRMERLASGSRINRAGDDAAGLAISEKFRANIRSMQQAVRNSNDGISMVQTAEGALNEVSNILVRLRELSIQSASDTIGDVERGFVDKEVQHLKKEINRIADSTEFNGYKLLNGGGEREKLDVQIGINNDEFRDRLSFDLSDLETSLERLDLDEVATLTTEGSQENLEKLDQALTTVNGHRANLGALQNRLGSTINNLNIYVENIAAANSRIRDTDVALEGGELTKSEILSQANIAVLGQANQNAAMALKLIA